MNVSRRGYLSKEKTQSSNPPSMNRSLTLSITNKRKISSSSYITTSLLPFLPPFPLLPHQRLHDRVREDALAWPLDPPDIRREHGSDLGLPHGPPRHQLPRHVADARLADAAHLAAAVTVHAVGRDAALDGVAAAARAAGPLGVLLRLAERARAFQVSLLHLAVEVLEDGGELLVRHLLLRQLQDALLPRAVDDAHLAQLLLQEAQPLGDLVVVVGVVIGLVVGGEEADVAQFSFEPLVDLGVREVLGVGGRTIEGWEGGGGRDGLGLVVGFLGGCGVLTGAVGEVAICEGGFSDTVDKAVWL